MEFSGGADHEEGTLIDWEFDRDPDNAGGGIFNTGKSGEAKAEADPSMAFTGRFCAKTTIQNAIRSQNGAKAVRLMRWTDKPWSENGKYFPKSAYYGVWMRLDHEYSTANPASSSGGWWNVFQFKSNDKQGNSQPVWVLNIGNSRKTGEMQFYLYSDVNRTRSVSQQNPVALPVGRWFHLEVFYKQSGKNETNGRITVWQDGVLILSANNVKTILVEKVMWGIGNYTDHVTQGINPGTATIYYDDATVSTVPTHSFAADKLKTRQQNDTKAHPN